MSEDLEKGFADLTEEERIELYGLEPGHDGDLRLWQAPGQASLDFLNSKELLAVLMGPVGQGKTTTMCLKRVADGVEQGVMKDGWVRDRGLILRKTWRTAQQTVLKDWLKWFPRSLKGSTFVGGQDRPADHTIRFVDITRFGSLNPVKVELQTQIRGLDENSIEEILRGNNFSRICLDEIDQFGLDAVELCEERTGRYPNPEELADGEVLTRQVTGAMNAPDKTNYLHDMLVENKKPNRVLYEAPPGLLVEWNADGTIGKFELNPKAENLRRLAADYYTSKALTWDDWKVRRMILNQWGYSRAGLPVFVKEFNEHRHISPRLLDYQKTLPLIIGIDGSVYGLRPAAVFLQPDGMGHLNLLRTFAPGQGTGMAAFWEGVKGIVDAEFYGCNSIEVWADPASQYGHDKLGGQLGFHEFGEVVMGRPVLIPFNGSNEIGTRLQCIRDELLLPAHDATPRLRISPHPSNKIVINGFASAYHYKRRPLNASSNWEAEPDKKAECSDPMDALQYGIGGFRRVTARTMATDMRGHNSRAPQGGWGSGRKDFDVHGV